MKYIPLLAVLLIISFSTHAQSKTTIQQQALPQGHVDSTFVINAKPTDKEKTEIKRMVRWEGDVLRAQPGYSFTKESDNSAILVNTARTFQSPFFCACLSGNKGCELIILSSTGIRCQNTGACVCILMKEFKRRVISLKAVFQ